jgi:predicted peroxiredoxin
MAKKILNIVSNAYRATSEEQDDTILWLVHAMKNAGSDVSILLQGSAVNYLDTAQETPALTFGQWKQSNPPNLIRDIEAMMAKGISFFYMEGDASSRGVPTPRILKGVKPVAATELPKLFEQFDLVNQW